MKECNVCGTFNLKDNKYCTHCGCYILEENICPFCGYKNPDSHVYCINCGKQITPITIDSFDVLFSEYNYAQMDNANVSSVEYNEILERMFRKLNYVSINGKTPKDKIIRIASVFTSVIPKSSGINHGTFKNTMIFFDDRLDDSFQIGTIIHELAHYLLFELTVNMLCKILNVNESSTLKAFVDVFLSSPQLIGINEFFAHTVENRYIPHDYLNFTSFNDLVLNSNYDIEDNLQYLLIIISYAKDIIGYLDIYIDEQLRELIKLQFREDKPNHNRQILFEVEELELDDVELDDIVKIRMFTLLMVDFFKGLYNNEEAREELEYIKNKFED